MTAIRDSEEMARLRGALIAARTELELVRASRQEYPEWLTVGNIVALVCWAMWLVIR